MQESCDAGDWVEIESVLLEAGERAAGVPPETAEQPLKMWVRGFARTIAILGQELEIETMTGRRVTGTLVEVNPGYTHSFGRPPRELAHVARDLRARVAEYRVGSVSDTSVASPGDATGPRQ